MFTEVTELEGPPIPRIAQCALERAVSSVRAYDGPSVYDCLDKSWEEA